MDGHDALGRHVTRRALLRGAAMAGAALAGIPLAAACQSSAPTPSPTQASAKPAADKPAAAVGGTKTIQFIGWTYEPEMVRKNLDRFESQNPGTKVDYTSVVVAQYGDKLVTMFAGNTPIDVLQVRDEDLAGWVDAGYLQPIDDMPRVDQYKQDMFPFYLQAATYKGKLWGLPYFTDFKAFTYNEEMLKKAGIASPPATLGELREQALAIKKAGIMDYPLVLDMKKASWAHRNWWAMVYAAGGSLFDGEFNPVFPDKDPTAVKVLEWIVNGVHTDKFIDLKSLEFDNNQIRDLFAAGQSAFVYHNKYDLQAFNDPKRSKVAGKAKMAMIPSMGKPIGGGKEHETIGFVRTYTFGRSVKDKEAAWKLIEYLGGKDSTGQYHTAKMWYVERGLGYGYKSLDQDPDVQKATATWGDPKMIAQQMAIAKPGQLVMCPWGSEWESFNYEFLQNAILRKMTPKEAMAASAEKAVNLKKEFKGR